MSEDTPKPPKKRGRPRKNSVPAATPGPEPDPQEAVQAPADPPAPVPAPPTPPQKAARRVPTEAEWLEARKLVDPHVGDTTPAYLEWALKTLPTSELERIYGKGGDRLKRKGLNLDAVGWPRA